MHLLGGLFVWAPDVRVCAIDTAAVVDARRFRLSVELCTVYWHYLLLVWLGVFALAAVT